MGEAKRRMEAEVMPGTKQVQVNIIFRVVFKDFVIPSSVSPTGKEHLVQVPILLCDHCGKEFEIKDA